MNTMEQQRQLLSKATVSNLMEVGIAERGERPWGIYLPAQN
jgi:hypothetical protein